MLYPLVSVFLATPSTANSLGSITAPGFPSVNVINNITIHGPVSNVTQANPTSPAIGATPPANHFLNTAAHAQPFAAAAAGDFSPAAFDSMHLTSTDTDVKQPFFPTQVVQSEATQC